jgi:hypothetical protein
VAEHQFTLILAGVSEITPELADALYEALDGDIEFGMCEGIARIDVSRTARTLKEAITSATEAVESAGVGIRVVRVESGVAE